MADLEHKANEYKITVVELTKQEHNVKQILERYIPSRSQELYEHITYRILDKIYLSDKDV